MIFKRTLFIFLALFTTCLCADDAAPSPTKPSQENTSTSAAAPEAPSESLSKPLSDPMVPAPLPSSEEMTTSYEGAFVRMLVTLLGLIILVFGTFWVLRRLGKGKFTASSGRSINILEKRPLSPKSMLYIVEMEQKDPPRRVTTKRLA